MLELKAKTNLALAAQALASSFELVQNSTTTFIPAHWATEEVRPLPPPEERIWLPMTRKEKMRLGNQVSGILFSSDSELSSFDFMLKQYAIDEDKPPTKVFIRTPDGLRVLDEQGALVEPTGEFIANCLKPVLNDDELAKKEVFYTISEWLDSEEEAHSLLYHLATALAPGYSAVKYVLLIGKGRNGKSVLLTMMVDTFGAENISNITRQVIAEEKATVTELNNKLLNVVFDGKMEYVKDSGLEKTLIAGEPGYIRLLYESSTTKVQTNALFVEALNKEPKSRDKSSALQKRLVRFQFPNTYADDKSFEKKMRSPEMLGAFLALLVDHYVHPDELATKLTPTKGALNLQVNQMWANSPMFQFITHLLSTDPTWRDKLVGTTADALVGSFMAWRVQEGYESYSSADVLMMIGDSFDLGWKSKRVNGKVAKVKTIVGLRPETQSLLEQQDELMKEMQHEALEELVGD